MLQKVLAEQNRLCLTAKVAVNREAPVVQVCR